MLEKRKKTGPKPRFTMEQAKAMYDLHMQNYTMLSIARHYNTSDATVCRLITKYKTGAFNKE
ncbi:hypothetical protein [Aeromonas veronii]|uniref:hypothetical protein n=1 Tax=Aeromonas veronii TaxID=654 RepID=UPI00367149E4